jgi:hypothetical protein
LSGNRKLLIEGNDQQFAIAELMKNFVPDWGMDISSWKVLIQTCNGSSNILSRLALAAGFKEQGIEALGLIGDADESFQGRWDSIKGFCEIYFPDTPDRMPESGLILSRKGTPRFGAWIIPGNKSGGMVEIFCRFMVPKEAESLWQYAGKSHAEAREHGADWLGSHKKKAHIHTWPAWRNPPGERMGSAIAKKLLDPDSDACKPFVKWFRELFQV